MDRLRWKSDLHGCRPVLGSDPENHQANGYLHLYSDDTPAVKHDNPTTRSFSMAQTVGARKPRDKPLLDGQMSLDNGRIVQGAKYLDMRRQLNVSPSNSSPSSSADLLTARVVRHLKEQGQEETSLQRQLEMLALFVPAIVFPNFPRLPVEVKIMIWNEALPTFIDIIINDARTNFCAPSPRDAIFHFCPDYATMFHMKPIYFNTSSSTSPNVFYIRPAVDIVHISTSTLLSLDIDTFVARTENQVIENLAIHAVSAFNCRWVGRQYGRLAGTRTWIGDLVRGLKNLKKLYVVEGERLHDDDELPRWRNAVPKIFDVSLQDVPAHTDIPKYDHRGKHYHSPPATPWVAESAQSVRFSFDAEVNREENKVYRLHYTNAWSVPELVCRLLVRKELCWERKLYTTKRLPWVPTQPLLASPSSKSRKMESSDTDAGIFGSGLGSAWCQRHAQSARIIWSCIFLLGRVLVTSV
ncbi:hypothetical protein B0O99DRAFT_624346 [Bisporella sp. PMI_857]|nr:hypothetical protein B0O99DRAFT_624346 [Bisporella sp. PMI_857]